MDMTMTSIIDSGYYRIAHNVFMLHRFKDLGAAPPALAGEDMAEYINQSGMRT